MGLCCRHCTLFICNPSEFDSSKGDSTLCHGVSAAFSYFRFSRPNSTANLLSEGVVCSAAGRRPKWSAVIGGIAKRIAGLRFLSFDRAGPDYASAINKPIPSKRVVM
jgi:hypothetical protein